MRRMQLLKTCLMALACFCLVLCAACAAEETRTVVDSRGVEVQIPAQIERVVTVSNGFIEGVMLVLGDADRIVGVGRSCAQSISNCTIPIVSGGTSEYQGGMQPVTFLYPRIRNLSLIAESNNALNYEALAGLDPDLVILRIGESSFPSMEDERAQKTIQTIEALGIPVVVLKAHTCFYEPDLTTISDEIRIIGNVFGKEEQAGKLADYLESLTQVVFERTKDIPETDRPNVLIFGASPTVRKAGGTGNVEGTDRIDSYIIEEIVHAKNAYRGTGQPTLSAEQLLALDPDVIVLCTANGYHPPEELYSAPYYQNVGELSAVKNRRIYTLPWLPCYAGKRIEYPIDVMVIAKAAYPERFADINLGEWLLDFYKNVYGVDDDTAKALRSAQWMDWAVEKV